MKNYLGEKVFIIAEMSCNHMQDVGKAIDLVYAAKAAGADAVKVQMFKPELMADPDDPYIPEGPWAGMTLYQLYCQSCMPYEWLPKLMKLAADIGIKFIATVYDPETVGLAEELGIEAYKISSYEACFDPLIEAVAATKKPMFVSIGHLTRREVNRVSALINKYQHKMAFLKCTSEYPASLKSLNLKTLLDMKRTHRWVGFSDHTDGIVAPVTAVAMGARIIEKHLKLPGDETLDADFSLDPFRFRAMTEAIRGCEDAIGKVKYGGDPDIIRTEVDGRNLRRVRDAEG